MISPAALQLPFPQAKAPAGLTEFVLSGSAAEQLSAGATVQGSAVQLSAGASGFEFALYRFNPGASGLDSVSVLLEEAATSGAWIGLADFDAQHWDLSGPYVKPKTLATDEPRYRSPGGDLWVAVIVPEQGSATVNALSVRTINPANQAPSAAVQADVTSGDAPLTVQFDASASTDSDSAIIEYAWDFDGDGLYDGFSDAALASRTYTSPGVFSVRLRVTDDQVARATDTVDITVTVAGNSAPNASFTRTPVSGDTPLEVEFDAGASNDSDGSIVRFDWDYDGDGDWDAYDSGPQVSHVYTVPGSYLPTLRVTDDAGAQDLQSKTITVNVAGNELPLAQFTATPDSGTAPLTVDFDASGSTDPDGAIARHDWDYDGDGDWDAYDSGPTVSHAYLAAGVFDARLRVTDDLGAQDIATLEISVSLAGNDSPSADITATPSSGDAALEVDFDGTGSSDSDGSIVRFDWDFDGDGSWDSYDGPEAPSHIYTGAGNYTAKLRVTDDAGAQDTATVDLAVNALPQAALETDTPKVNVGETLFLDATGSSDSDGTIDDYEWDLDGDGTYNETGAEADQQGDAVAALTAGTTPGTTDVSVRVSDDDGAQSVTTLEVTVRGWLTLTVDSFGGVGVYPSLALVDGKPAISYFHEGFEDLMYAYSSLADGSSGWTTLTVESTGAVGLYTSLAAVNGKPAISYFDDDVNDLKYAYSSLADGSSGWSTLTVDSAGGVGADTSLAVVNGKPAIGYRDATNSDLKYAYSSIADGSSGWTALTVDSTGSVGNEPSLAVVNGKPAISYWDSTGGDLKYAYSSTADGSSGWTTLAVDSTGSVGRYSSLAFVNGKPAISYWDGTNVDLKYAYSSVANGSGGWTALTIDSAGSVGSRTSLAVLDGKPAISYYDDTNIDLKFAFSDMANGSGDWTAQAADSTGFVGSFTSLAEINGRPAIAYYAFTGADLKYAVHYD